MSNNKDKKFRTWAEQPRNTALLSDILPLPEPWFHGRIGNTYADSEADIISVPRRRRARPTCLAGLSAGVLRQKGRYQ
jgi:hypothetical protein